MKTISIGTKITLAINREQELTDGEINKLIMLIQDGIASFHLGIPGDHHNYCSARLGVLQPPTKEKL
jgi:hypothetical protein